MTSENWGVWSERQSIGHAISWSLALGASHRSSRQLHFLILPYQSALPFRTGLKS